MNSNDNLPHEPGTDAAPPTDGSPDDAGMPAKRRPRKSAAAVTEAGDAPSLAASQGEPAEAGKPVRRRKPKTEAADEQGNAVSRDAGDGDMGKSAAAIDPPEPRSESPTAASVSSDGSGSAAPVQALSTGADADEQTVSRADDAAAEGAAGEGAVPAGGEAGSESLEPGRRSRNRRRGRKDRPGREMSEDAQAGHGAPSDASLPGDRGQREASMLPDPAETVERFAEVLSGAYDAEPPEPDDAATLEQSTKRVLRPEPEAPKLHKVLAQSGIGSRRDMEQLIQEGGVTVNDEVAHIGMRISHGDRVKVSGKPVKVRIQGAPARLLAYHKPVGEVVSFNDPEGRPTVFRRLPRLENGKWQSVGRLDINTEGLLLFSNSGELANQLMHPRFGIEREYAVRVLGSLDDEQRSRLIEGVQVDGQTANFKSIEDGGGDGANRWYRVVITEGRNREVRKLFDTFGLAVSRLIRIRYGSVVLPRGLKRGVWVELGEQDLRRIRQSIGSPRAEPREPQQPQRAERAGARNGRNAKPVKGAGRTPQPPVGRSNEPRGPRRDREPRPYEAGPDATDGSPHDRDDFGPIPNPLEQTFDRRFAKGPRRGGAQGFGHGGSKPEADFGPAGTIPNPLEQTFDKRFVKGSQRINAGFGRPDNNSQDPGQGPRKGGPKQPDPMQTSVGYIGADAYFTKAGGKRSGGGGGGRGGQGGGGRFGGRGR